MLQAKEVPLAQAVRGSPYLRPCTAPALYAVRTSCGLGDGNNGVLLAHFCSLRSVEPRGVQSGGKQVMA